MSQKKNNALITILKYAAKPGGISAGAFVLAIAALSAKTVVENEKAQSAAVWAGGTFAAVSVAAFASGRIHNRFEKEWREATSFCKVIR
ncbi:MAG: hypothetical protein LBU87_00525 [Lactobacillales bacterium]|nr:hypothetical protein [Lactobacillales bacterium]